MGPAPPFDLAHSRCDAMRWRCVDERLVDLARSIWHESRSHHDLGPPMCSFAMRRSPIITAHAKMQFKLQVHVVSRSRQGRRFRARLDAGRFRMIQSNVYARWLLLRPRFVMQDRDTPLYFITTRAVCSAPTQTKRGNPCMRVFRSR